MRKRNNSNFFDSTTPITQHTIMQHTITTQAITMGINADDGTGAGNRNNSN